MVECWGLNGMKNPDGRLHVPCNTTAIDVGGHSTCCPLGDLCLTNGMCKDPKNVDTDNWYTRRACTDKSWNDPACPSYCKEIEPTRNTGLIHNCQKKESWCCAYVGVEGFKGWPKTDRVNTTCCTISDLTFKAADPTPYATALLYIRPTAQVSASASPISNLASTPLATGTGADTSSLPTASNDESSGNNLQNQDSSTGMSTGAKIGLGVGIPLAVLGLAAIGAFFWLRKRRTTGTRETSELLGSTANSKQEVPPYQETHMNQHGPVMYRHEAPPSHPIAELSGVEAMSELPPQSKSTR